MKWLLSLLIAAITGILGLFTIGFLGRAYVTWFHYSSIRLTNDYMVLFFALIGGGVSFVIGLVISRISPFPFIRTLACAWTAVFAISGIGLALLWTRADFATQPDGDRAELDVEIRLPADQNTDPRQIAGKASCTVASIILNTRCNDRDGALKINEARSENGHWIIPGLVPVVTTTAPCVIHAQLGGKDLVEFTVPLSAQRDTREGQWSNWAAQSLAGQPAPPDSKASYRFRLRRPPPPPKKSASEYYRERMAAPTGKLDVVPPMPSAPPPRFPDKFPRQQDSDTSVRQNH